MDKPDYYLRYNKSFNRMGGTMGYVTANNPTPRKNSVRLA